MAEVKKSKVRVQFSGGLETYFGNQKEILLMADLADDKFTIKELIEELRANHMTDKEEMFVQNSTVRPGIIVLVNDTDWELEGQTEYAV